MNIDVEEMIKAGRKSLAAVEVEIKELENDRAQRSVFHGEGVPVELNRKLARLYSYRDVLTRFIVALVEVQEKVDAETRGLEKVPPPNDAGGAAGEDAGAASRPPHLKSEP